MAVICWATRCFCWQKNHVLVPKCGQKIPLQLRFIDDIFALDNIGKDGGTLFREWNTFKKDLNNFELLRWKANEPSISANFLQLKLIILKITIEAGKITLTLIGSQHLCTNTSAAIQAILLE